MIFSSLLFLCIFLPIVLLLYHLSKNITYRNVILVIASLFFYAWGEPIYVLALIFSSLVDYTCGRVIDKTRGTYKAKLALFASLVINLGLLATFKYSGFFVSNFNSVFNTSISIRSFALPLGISFYTFQTMSYTIDMYNDEVCVQKSLLKFMVYVSMFPQLVAGPIVRYRDIQEDLNDRHVSLQDFECGILRFSKGMFKKVLLANSAGKIVSIFLDYNLSSTSSCGLLLGLLMYTFQIYYDFSGYSDMAIGLGRMFGFHFLENFDYPYTSKSITEFWRRWHISLGTFFRDYVYIPLGGNRKRQILNIIIVWFLTGFWHGASWNFILWGVYYAVWLIVEKFLLKNIMNKIPAIISHIYSCIIVMFGWALFYFTDFSRLFEFFRCLFSNTGVWCDAICKSMIFENLFLIIALFLCSTPIFKIAGNKIMQKSKACYNALSVLFMVIVFVSSFILLVGQTYNPFLYFRF